MRQRGTAGRSPFATFLSAAPDCNHDFEGVAVVQFQQTEFAARNDFAIAFQCDALALQLELFDQPGDLQRGRKRARLAVDGKRDHFKIPNGFCNMNASTGV